MGRARQERELSLLAKVDEQTIKRSIARINDLSASYNDLSKTQVQQEHASIESAAGLDRFDGESRQVISTLHKQIAVLKLDIQAQRDRLKVIHQQTGAIEDQTRAQDRLNQERKQSGSAASPSLAERAGDVSTGVSALAALAPGPAGDIARVVADLSGFVEQIPRLGEALGSVVTSGGPATAAIAGAAGSLGTIALSAGIAAPAVIAVGFALQEFFRIVEEGRGAVKRAVEAQRLYFDTIATGNREAITEQIRNLEAQRTAAQQTLVSIRESATETHQLFGVTIPAAITSELSGLTTAAIDAGKEIDDLTVQIDALQRAAGSQEIARLNAVQQELARLQNQTDAKLSAQSLGASGSSAQVAARLEAIDRERQAIQEQIAAMDGWVRKTEDGRRAIAALEGKLIDLQREEESLTEIALPLIQAREAEARAIEKEQAALDKATELIQARADFNTAIAEQEQRVEAERAEIAQKATDAIAKAGEKLVADIARIEQDLAQAETESARKLDQAIAKAETEAVEREKEIREESAKRINDLEERYARERQQIIDQYNFDANTAIQNRDAVALDTAKRTRDKGLKDLRRDHDAALKEERRALKERLDANKKSNEERIRDLRASYEQERRDRRAAADQRIADLREANQREIEAIRDREQQALTVLEQRNQQEIDQIRQHAADVLAKYGIHFGQLESLTNTELGQLLNKWAAFFNSLSSAAEGNPEDTVWDEPIEEAARGIENFRNGTLMVGEEGPELMHVNNGRVSVKSNRDTMRTLAGMAGMVKSQVRNVNNTQSQRVVNVNAGAFSANLSGGDPSRLVRELERRMYRRLPNILADILERN